MELTFIGFLIFQTGLHCHSLRNYRLNNNFKLAGPDRMLMGQTIMVINNQRFNRVKLSRNDRIQSCQYHKKLL